MKRSITVSLSYFGFVAAFLACGGSSYADAVFYIAELLFALLELWKFEMGKGQNGCTRRVLRERWP